MQELNCKEHKACLKASQHSGMLAQDFTSASRSPWANLSYVFQLCPSWKQLGLDIVFDLWIFRNSLVFQIAPVCGLSMLHFPAQVLYLCFQLCLLVFKLKLMNYQIKHFRESWKSSNLPILSWDRALCSRRRDMCTEACIWRSFIWSITCTISIK